MTVELPKPTELIWIRYSENDKFYFVFYLGRNENIIHVLLADKVPDREITLIRLNIRDLKLMDLPTMQAWLKVHTPMAYSVAYRSMKIESISIQNTYKIKTS